MSAARLDVAVIGGASLDVLRRAGRVERSAGGAGLYTAVAAACAGARAGMLGPRPDPMPEPLSRAAERIAWFGPRVGPDDLPRFEITHHEHGHATLDAAVWGAETALSPAELTPELLEARIVHVAALSSVRRQIDFADACRAAGSGRVSAGTYAKAIQADAAGVRALFERCDVCFMNENEARLLYGGPDRVPCPPGRVAFVTLGARGAVVHQGEHRSLVPGRPAHDVDPTGAGDTFCGATLAGLAAGDSPVLAARAGVGLASEMVEQVGPARLVSPRPAPGVVGDPRVAVDPGRLAELSALLAGHAGVAAFDFTGPGLPPPGNPLALDYFFAATLQQFGFWDLAGGRYAGPYVAALAGERLKGSDYLWAALWRAFAARPERLHPASHAEPGWLESALAPDPGQPTMPALELHAEAARAYGTSRVALGWSPAGMVAAANAAALPRRALLERLDHVGGYREDPLRKKSALLALILEQRPERFLRREPVEAEWPVVDYHVMRTCLRTGLVRVDEPDLRRRIADRRELDAESEWGVRWACFEAVAALARRSGRGIGAIDACFFAARRRCPEITEPDCARCLLDPACAHAKELFQPVRRTAAY